MSLGRINIRKPLVVVLLSGWFGTLGLAAIVATIVYFVDVRPALRRVRGTRR